MGSSFAHQDKKAEAVGDSTNVDICGVAEVESADWDRRSTAKLLRKLDWNIIPIMSIIYLYADHIQTQKRTNTLPVLGSASWIVRTSGMLALTSLKRTLGSTDFSTTTVLRYCFHFICM